MQLPGEVFITLSWYTGEVSKSLNTSRELVTTSEILNLILQEFRMGAIVFVNE